MQLSFSRIEDIHERNGSRNYVIYSIQIRPESEAPISILLLGYFDLSFPYLLVSVECPWLHSLLLLLWWVRWGRLLILRPRTPCACSHWWRGQMCQGCGALHGGRRRLRGGRWWCSGVTLMLRTRQDRALGGDGRGFVKFCSIYDRSL